MGYRYAVRYFDAQFDTNSQLVKNQPFTLWKDSAATQAATTYTDRTKTTVQSGSLATDNKGMATFWVDPGTYWIRFGANTPVELSELREDNDETVSIGSDDWLKANVSNVTYISITRDGNGAVTAGTVIWPDGVGGAYTADTVSTVAPGAVDAYHVTYTPSGSTTKTVTQPAITRSTSTGLVTAQPALVVS
jgi:hypothetical protein